MKRILVILMPTDFKDVEFLVPYKALKDAGHEVIVAGLAEGDAVGAEGTTQTPDVQLQSLSDEDLLNFDALFIPGGPGSTKHLWGNKDVQRIASYFHENGKILATICFASIVPAEAGLLKGKAGSVYPTDETLATFKTCDVTYSDDGVTTLTEERIITAQGPKFVKEFAAELLALLRV